MTQGAACCGGATRGTSASHFAPCCPGAGDCEQSPQSARSQSPLPRSKVSETRFENADRLQWTTSVRLTICIVCCPLLDWATTTMLCHPCVEDSQGPWCKCTFPKKPVAHLPSKPAQCTFRAPLTPKGPAQPARGVLSLRSVLQWVAVRCAACDWDGLYYAYIASCAAPGPPECWHCDCRRLDRATCSLQKGLQRDTCCALVA